MASLEATIAKFSFVNRTFKGSQRGQTITGWNCVWFTEEDVRNTGHGVDGTKRYPCLTVKSSLLVNPAVKPVNQVSGSYPETVTNSQERSDRNWPASLNLLSVTGRKTESDHVLLCVPMRLAKFFDANAQSTEELSLINHPIYLVGRSMDDHEQISWEE